MKTRKIQKLLAASLALLLLTSLTGCNIYIGGDRIPSPTIPSQTQGATPTQAPTETAAPALRLDELVTVGNWLHLVGSDGYNDYDYLYVVPQINLSSEDAAECNDEISQLCKGPMADAQEAHDGGYSLIETGISYEASLCDGLLSLLVQRQNDWGMSEYYVCLLDTVTGEELDNDDLFEWLGMTESECDSFIYDTVKAYFEETNRDAISNGYADEHLYQQMYDNTLAEDNLDDAMLYLNTDGELMLCVNIYGFAGADSYWYLIPTAKITPQFTSCDGLFSPESIEE